MEFILPLPLIKFGCTFFKNVVGAYNACLPQNVCELKQYNNKLKWVVFVREKNTFHNTTEGEGKYK